MATQKQLSILNELFDLDIINHKQYQEALIDSRYCYKLIGKSKDEINKRLLETSIRQMKDYVAKTEGILLDRFIDPSHFIRCIEEEEY